MDLFGDDIDSLLQTEDDKLNENIRSDIEDDDNENNENKDENEKNDDLDGQDEAKKVEPKKRAVRNPQLRLNIERLKSERGIHTVEKYFTDIKFVGKGHERHDLNNVMKRLEHWAHRLYPNYNFDDFIGTVEKLGRKKQMQTHMYRYRQGLLDEVVKNNIEHDDNEEERMDQTSEPIDELDEIINQQIEHYSVAPQTPAHDRTFDSIRSSMVDTPRLRQQMPVKASTPIVGNAGNESVTAPANKLTSEQMAKIAENRRLAQERLQKKKMDQAAAAIALNQSQIDIV